MIHKEWFELRDIAHKYVVAIEDAISPADIERAVQLFVKSIDPTGNILVGDNCRMKSCNTAAMYHI